MGNELTIERMQTLNFRQSQLDSPIYKGGNPISLLVEKFGLDPEAINKLGSNENPLPTPDSVKKAIAQATHELNRYPPTSAELSEQLAAYIGRDLVADNFVIGNGGCEVLDLIAKSFVDPGDEAIICRPTFPIYDLTLRRLGANVVYADMNDDFTYNVERILAAVTDKTRLLYMTTPNNPTGTILTKAEQDELISRLPKHVLIVADEVYWQFNTDESMADSLRYVQEDANIVILHSFSKLFGLAGLRMGYAIGPERIISYLKRGQLPFHMNAVSIAAGMAAVADRDQIEETISMTLTERPKLTAGLAAIDGIEVVPSQANFVLIKPEKDSKEVEEALQSQGVIVRDLTNFYMPGYLRVSVGQPHENEALLDALTKIIAS